ncbi:MAG: hypothetical protein RLZZ524_664 [Pseudomonadota bacterium]
MKAAALLLALCAFAAQAQLIGPCTSSDPPPPLAAVTPHAMPQGYRYTLAACTLPIVGWSDAGGVVGWGCIDGTKLYTAAFAVRRAAITQEMVASFAAIPFAADPRIAARDHFARFGTEHFLGMADVWCEPAGTDWRPRYNAAILKLVADNQAPPGWASAGAGTLYRVSSAGARSIIAGRTVPNGTPCNCSAPILYLGQSLCRLASGPADEVTLCRKP